MLTELAQADAPPTILHAGPRESWVEGVTPVQEHRAGVEFVDQVQEGLLRCGVARRIRPYGRCESVWRVVHQCDRLNIRSNLLDANHGPERLFLQGERSQVNAAYLEEKVNVPS